MIRCGRLPGLLGLHKQQRVRCTKKICPALGLVQETAGVVVGFAFDDREDTSWLDDPDHFAWSRGWVLLKYLPRGVHVRIDVEPGAEEVQYIANEERGIWTFTPEAAMSDKISLEGQHYYFTRAQIPLYSADDGTTNSLQGSTKDYLIADGTPPPGVTPAATPAATRRDQDDQDDDDDGPGRGRYWAHMYVKLSRVKWLERLLLLNAPPNLRELMEAGPPADTVTETLRILLLERDTVPRAEEALRRLTWDADDEYYGAEACARLRAWAEDDWAHAEEKRAARETSENQGENGDGAPETPRDRAAGQKAPASDSPPGKRRQQQDIHRYFGGGASANIAGGASASCDVEVIKVPWGSIDVGQMHGLLDSCYEAQGLHDRVIHSVDLGQYCRDLGGISHSNMSRPPAPRAGAGSGRRVRAPGAGAGTGAPARAPHALRPRGRCLFIHFCLALSFDHTGVTTAPLDEDIQRWQDVHVPRIRDDQRTKQLWEAARVQCSEPPVHRPAVVMQDAPLTGALAVAAVALRRLLPNSTALLDAMEGVHNWTADFGCPAHRGRECCTRGREWCIRPAPPRPAPPRPAR